MANIKWSAFPNAGDLQVGDIIVGLRTGVNEQFTFPSVGIKDSSGNYLLQWASVGAAAVNYLVTNNSATGNPSYLTTAGADASVGLTLKTKGSGNILFTPGGTGNIQCSTHLILSTSSPATSLEAASKGYVDSLIPSLPLSLANGGTSASLTANNGGIFYSTNTAGAILSGTATANQVLLSGLSSAPAWSTATYPATTTVSQLLYSSSSNVIAGLTTANNGVLVTGNTGVPSLLAGSGVAGNVLMSNTAAAPSWSTAVYSNTYTINNLLYASSANTVSGLATGNNGVLITSGLGVPSISSTLPSAVQGNITTLGTITSGVWNGTLISPQYGGTGVNNGTSTITIGGNFAMSGAYTFVGTLTNNTTVTFPTSGTLATTSQLPSLPLSLANGGTNASLTASNGGIFYSTASAGAILSGTATANQIILSGSNTTPAWSTATYPATTTINQLLYSSSANVISGLATANDGVLVTSNSGVPSWLANGTAGYVLTANTGAPPSWQAATSSGTVNSGTANQIAYYATTGTAVSGLTGANSSMLVTNSTGVPAMTGSLTNGQIIIGSTGATPTPATLTAGTGITVTNAAAAITLAATGTLRSFQIFTSGSAATYTKPAGVNNILVEIIGGGGGGGGITAGASTIAVAGGGGGGGYCRKWITSAASTYTYTVGGGGAGGVGLNNGTGGTNSTFSTLTANGGNGGGGANGIVSSAVGITIPGVGGASSGGDFNCTGGAGGAGFNIFQQTVSGYGGSSFLTGQTSIQTATVANGLAGLAYGGGGGGALGGLVASTSQNGGAGAAGLIIVWEFS